MVTSQKKSPDQGLKEAGRKNILSIGLDFTGLALSAVPGGGLAVAGAGLAVAAGGLVNSGAHGDFRGLAVGAAGYHITAVAPAAEQFARTAAPSFAKGVAELVPGVGTIVAGLALVNDGFSVYDDYNKCLGGGS